MCPKMQHIPTLYVDITLRFPIVGPIVAKLCPPSGGLTLAIHRLDKESMEIRS